MNLQTLIITLNCLVKGYSFKEISNMVGDDAASECVTFLLLGNPWEQLSSYVLLRKAA